MSHVLSEWKPEDESFWNEKGKKIAWRTLIITTASLTFSFATWFMMSAIVVRLPNIGFKFDTMELFWLAAMPGLAGGTLRIIHTFLVPIFGTRNVIAYSTIIKLIPCVGIGLAILDPNTPFAVFMILAFSAGFGGGDFSSFMPSTSIFFPKRLQGTALGIQAGIGNFGVSLAQFITPWIIGFAMFGTLLGSPQSFTKGEITKSIWLQNAAFIYIPFLIVLFFLALTNLKSVPMKATFKEQLDIFKNKHTWFCTIIYIMTFGSFSGLSAAFPLLIKTVYGNFPDAPDPLAYAFIGPLIGSAARVVFGPISDKIGGAILTFITGLALIIGSLFFVFSDLLTPSSLISFDLFVVLMVSMFLFTGIGNASTFRQFPIIFGHSPRQAAGVLGWTAAVAAYGPFIFSVLIGWVISSTGNAKGFFIGSAIFYFIATFINYWYYTRKGCEKPC